MKEQIAVALIGTGRIGQEHARSLASIPWVIHDFDLARFPMGEVDEVEAWDSQWQGCAFAAGIYAPF